MFGKEMGCFNTLLNIYRDGNQLEQRIYLLGSTHPQLSGACLIRNIGDTANENLTYRVALLKDYLDS